VVVDSRALDVWMNGERVGVWARTRSGVSTFQYDPSWESSPRGRPISLSLPFIPGSEPHRGPVVDHWFDNLLPDSRQIRDRIRRRFRAASSRAFDLLAAVGRDCAGAVQLVEAGATPGDVRRIRADVLTEADIAKHLRAVVVPDVLRTAAEADAFRISIAGAQEKTAFLRWDGAWQVPNGATPTTHIFKLPLGLLANRMDMRDSVENEWACLQFLGVLGFSVARAEIGCFGDDSGEERALIVERFDRRLAPGARSKTWIQRLPQEDICQALGRSPDQRYESDGGPTLENVMSLLAASESALADRLTLARAQLAFWLLAATDGHAKNFSIFLRRTGYVMTPLYDVLSAWPIIGTGQNQLAYQKAELAMGLRGDTSRTRRLGKIALRHWRRLADATAAPDAFAQMVAMAESSVSALDATEQMLPPEFPAPLWSAIRSGVLRHRALFLRQASGA
jgi:serine/threonine-protein kinase HipA